MAQRQKKEQQRRQSSSRADTLNPKRLDLDDHLDRILNRLAMLLLRNGYGYQRISKLTKKAFVDAAVAIGAIENSTLSTARIAALTGLTRTEVSRLRRIGHHDEGLDAEFNRATKVARGWITDSRFSTKLGKPRPLSLVSKQSGFAQLVRRYSGDIPAKAMLLEMQRLGMVELRGDNVVTLVRRVPTRADESVNAIRAISPWVDVLSETRAAETATHLSSAINQVRLRYDTPSQVLASARELEQRRRSFIEALAHLGASKPTGKYELTVSIAVAAAQPRRQRSTSKRKTRT